MPPRPKGATIRYRSMRTVPGENPAPCSGRDLTGAGAGLAVVPLGSNVGASGMAMARPQEGHNRALSEHNAPQPEQVTMRTDCIPPQEAPVNLNAGMRRIYADRRVQAEAQRCCKRSTRPIAYQTDYDNTVCHLPVGASSRCRDLGSMHASGSSTVWRLYGHVVSGMAIARY